MNQCFNCHILAPQCLASFMRVDFIPVNNRKLTQKLDIIINSRRRLHKFNNSITTPIDLLRPVQLEKMVKSEGDRLHNGINLIYTSHKMKKKKKKYKDLPPIVPLLSDDPNDQQMYPKRALKVDDKYKNALPRDNDSISGWKEYSKVTTTVTPDITSNKKTPTKSNSHFLKKNSGPQRTQEHATYFNDIHSKLPNDAERKKPKVFTDSYANAKEISSVELDSKYEECEAIKILIRSPSFYKLLGNDKLSPYNHLNVSDFEAIMRLAKLGIYPVDTETCITYAEYEPLIVNAVLEEFKADLKEFVGLDTEFYELDNGMKRLALIQIALSETVVLIVFTKYLNNNALRTHAPRLLSLFENKSIVKAGVGIWGDCARINSYYKLKNPIIGCDIARLFDKDNNPLEKTLDCLAFVVLDINVIKSKKKKKWDQVIDIPMGSIRYAALDARLSYLLYMHFLKNKKLETVRKIQETEGHNNTNNIYLPPAKEQVSVEFEKSVDLKHALRKVSVAYHSNFK